MCEPEWESIAVFQIDRGDSGARSILGDTLRLEVPGGYLYQTVIYTNGGDLMQSSGVFVPAPQHQEFDHA